MFWSFVVKSKYGIKMSVNPAQAEIPNENLIFS